MYHLYGSIVVMSSYIALNSYHQKTLIRAVKLLSEADAKMEGYAAKIDWKTTRNYTGGKPDEISETYNFHRRF